MAKSKSGTSPVIYTTGAEVITDTVAHVGEFSRIDFYENSTINTILSTNVVDNNFSGATVDAGAHLDGHFTSIRLTNGACIAYKI